LLAQSLTISGFTALRAATRAFAPDGRRKGVRHSDG
jgi:hypothetical protein